MRRDHPVPEGGHRKAGQVRPEQHRGRRLPGVQRIDVEPAVEVADRHGAEHAAGARYLAGTGQRERRGQAHPDIGTGGERRLVELGLAPALVLGKDQGAGAHGEDDEQDRPALLHRPPAHLPARQRGDDVPAAGAQPVEQPGGRGQHAQRQQREPGQGEDRREGEHRVDAQGTAGQPGHRRVPAQLPESHHAEQEQRGVQAGPRGGGQRGLPAAPEPGGAGGRRAERGPYHDEDDEHGDDGGGPPGAPGQALAGEGQGAGTVRQPAGRHQQRRQITAKDGTGHHAGHRDQGRLGERGAGQLPAGDAPRGQQRVLLLPLGGQQPGGQRGGGGGQQDQLQRPDQQQRPGDHQAAAESGQRLRQAGGRLQFAQVLPRLQGRHRRAEPGADRAGIAGCDPRGVHVEQPGRLAHGERAGAERGGRHEHRPVGDERALHQLARGAEQAQPPVRVRRIPRPEQPGHDEPGPAPGEAVGQREHLAHGQVQHGRRAGRQCHRDRPPGAGRAGPVPGRQNGVTGDPVQGGGLDAGGLARATRLGQRKLVGPAAAEHLEAGMAERRGDRGADHLRVGIGLGGADLAADLDHGVGDVGQPPVLGHGQRPGAEGGQGHGDHRRGQHGQQQAGRQQPGPPHPAQHERGPGAPGPIALIRPGRAARALAQAPSHAADATYRPPDDQRRAAMVTRLGRNCCPRGVAVPVPSGTPAAVPVPAAGDEGHLCERCVNKP